MLTNVCHWIQPHIHALFPTILFNIILPYTSMPQKSSFPFNSSDADFVFICHLSHTLVPFLSSLTLLMQQCYAWSTRYEDPHCAFTYTPLSYLQTFSSTLCCQTPYIFLSGRPCFTPHNAEYSDKICEETWLYYGDNITENKILTFACRGEYDFAGHDFVDVSSAVEPSTTRGRQTLTVLDSRRSYTTRHELTLVAHRSDRLI